MRAANVVLSIAVIALIPGLASAQEPQTDSGSLAERWQLREELRLGSFDSGGPDQFGAIASIVVDRAGRIYVLEAFAQEVRVFEPDGTFVYAVGGAGAGPGEFQGATQLAIGPDGAIWVTDPVASRYTGFSRDGQLLATVPRPVLGYNAPGAFLDDGSYVDWAVAFPDEGPDVVAGATIILLPVRLSASFEPADTLPSITFQQPMIEELGIPQVFFKARPHLFVSKKASIWFSGTDGYRVTRLAEPGTPLEVEREFEPAPVTDADRDLVATTYRGRPELLDAYLDALPETKPPVHAIVGDDSGFLYVVPEDSGKAAGTALDVFSESGVYLGRLDLPVPIGRRGAGSLDPIFTTADHVYYVTRDDLDIPYVSRLRIIRP